MNCSEFMMKVKSENLSFIERFTLLQTCFGYFCQIMKISNYCTNSTTKQYAHSLAM